MPDVINGLFELLGAPFILMSVLKLRKEKEVKGVSWVHVLFFTMWGFWNLYYYPFLNQWCSFFGGIAIVMANALWVGLLIYYSRKKVL